MNLSYQDFEKIIEDIEIIDNDKEKEDKILYALSKLNQIDTVLYQKYYLAGCLWYLMPYDNEERDFEIENNLIKSIEINKEYLHSKVQLSYFYFDKKNYSKVIELLDNLKISLFEDNGQLWKSLKLQEILFVSRLSFSEKITNDLINECTVLVTSYINLPNEYLTVPIELINSILFNSEKEGIEKLAFLCLSLINSKNQSTFFEDEIRSELLKISNNG